MEKTPDTCICCGGDKIAPHFEGLLKCVQCSHIWADLRLSEEELKALYSRDYYHGAEYVDYEHEEPALRRNFLPRVNALKRILPKGSRLWEIGAAYGFFLKEASSWFEAAGCEISEHSAGFAREVNKVDVRALDYLTYQPDAPFDAICMWDTIEHLSEPHKFVAKAAQDLKSGGALMLTTGDIGALTARIRGRKWRLLHPPTHLHYFTVQSLSALLERNGFEDIRISHPAFWRSFDAVAYNLLGKRGEAGAAVYRALKSTGVLNHFFPLNTFDLMLAHARKK
jgi:SAM-dependent methyltransferase